MLNTTGRQVHKLITEAQIRRRVAQLARQISRDYQGEDLLVVGILKGSWVFLADLVRRITVPVYVDFMTVSSYGASTKTSGIVKTVMDLKCPIQGRNVLIVEDILDTGLTLRYILKILKLRNPASLKLCVLLDKPSRRQVEIKADYTGFTIPDRFVVGYGADVAERFRNLPYVGYIREKDSEVQGQGRPKAKDSRMRRRDG